MSAPEDGHVYECCGKVGRISPHESWCRHVVNPSAREHGDGNPELERFIQKRRAGRSVAMALTELYTRDELGDLYDLVNRLSHHKLVEPLSYAIGVAWADYAYGGDEDAASNAAVKRGEIL